MPHTKEELREEFTAYDLRDAWAKEADKAKILKRLNKKLKSLLEQREEEIKKLNDKVPCDCPKGGLVGENEYPCDKCGGTQWYRRHICAYNDGDFECECYKAALNDVLSLPPKQKEELPPLQRHMENSFQVTDHITNKANPIE